MASHRLALVGAAAAAVALGSVGIARGAEASSLLEADPLGYDLDTLRRLARAVRDLPEMVSRELPAIVARGKAAGPVSTALILLLFAFILLWAMIGRRRLASRIEARAGWLSPSVAGAVAPWLVAALQVLGAAGPPFLLWLAHDALARATGFRGPGFLLTGVLLGAWARYALVVAVLRELLLRPLLPLPVEHRRYLWAVGHGLAIYGLLIRASLDVGVQAGLAPDMVALLESLSDLALIVILTALATRKAALLVLLPVLPNRLYRGFVAGLEHAWGLVLALTAATALAAWAGYGRLAEFVWLRTWALAGLFVGTLLALHGAHGLLRRWILAGSAGRGTAERFYRSATRMLDYVAVLAALRGALELLGLAGPLGSFLTRPLYALADHPVSALMLMQAALVVGAFVVLSRLLRDFLDYRVYPTLGVDQGIAHAVNTFIAYSMSIVGVLFALEYVGLGLGALTVFAGALGIGLGFGMQSLANNLSSGITLVFGGALRKGDWVTVGDTIGVIEDVGMRATTLRTRDSIEYLVPNADFVSGTIVNWTRSSPLVCQHVPVGVAYGSDPEVVRGLLLEVAAETPGVRPLPEPEVRFTGFGASSLDFELLVWVDVKETVWPRIRSDVNFAVFRRFREAGVSIPFPQRDLHVRSVAPEVLEAVARPAALSQAARHLLDRAADRRL